MNNTIKDFDLDLKTNKKDTATPYVGSRYLCTPWFLLEISLLYNNC